MAEYRTPRNRNNGWIWIVAIIIIGLIIWAVAANNGGRGERPVTADTTGMHHSTLHNSTPADTAIQR
jgi:hypothetical protein